MAPRRPGPAAECPAEGSARLQDPSIKQMAEALAQDPAFAQMSQTLQSQLQGSGLGPAAAQDRSPGAAGGMPDPSQMDPAAAQEAMASMFQNPQFMDMAQNLGQRIMEVRGTRQVLCGPALITAQALRCLSRRAAACARAPCMLCRTGLPGCRCSCAACWGGVAPAPWHRP